METPDQLLSRLDIMGEDRVRALVSREYFEPKAVTLVQGWLARKEQSRVKNETQAPQPDLEELLEKARALASQASRAAVKAQECATQAGETAKKAHRVAVIAIAVGSAGLLISILSLFALALR